uniref:Uncharacterized protein n=1 Tax=Anopheles coluzzii TaxID=1518534 RepID=A0A8W7P7Y6_ANOCL
MKAIRSTGSTADRANAPSPAARLWCAGRPLPKLTPIGARRLPKPRAVIISELRKGARIERGILEALAARLASWRAGPASDYTHLTPHFENRASDRTELHSTNTEKTISHNFKSSRASSVT